jgi:predicted LPLAT superfamily acyltransferase
MPGRRGDRTERKLVAQRSLAVTPEWLAQAERSNTLAIRSIAWIALGLGRRVAHLILYPVCFYFLLFSLKARSASRLYLRRVFQREPTWSEVFQHYLTFARVTLDRVFLLNDQSDLFDIQVQGEELLTESMRSRQGCFLIGAHLGSFEVLRAFGKTRNQMRVRMIMFEGNARKVRAVLDALDPDWSKSIIEAGHLDSMLKLEEALERGEFVGMLGDRTLSGESQLRCRFLGTDAAFSTAPFRIAAMLKRPVILMLGLHCGGNRYELHFERLHDFANTLRGQREAQVAAAIGAYIERLEDHCRRAPYNWFNFYDFWKSDESDDARRHT